MSVSLNPPTPETILALTGAAVLIRLAWLETVRRLERERWEEREKEDE